MNKSKVKMSKPMYPGLSILDISKRVILEFCYDYINSKFNEKAKLWHMHIDSFNIKYLHIYCR